MLPQWWLQFDERFLQSRAAAFASRIGQAGAATPFLAGLESRLSEMVERAGWLERFLVRGAPHAGSMAFAYESTAYPDLQFLALEEELDDMSEEAALGWLRRVAPAHPVVRRLEKAARDARTRAAAAAPSRKAGAALPAASPRTPVKRGARAVSASPAVVASPARAPGASSAPLSDTAVDALPNVGADAEAEAGVEPARGPVAAHARTPSDLARPELASEAAGATPAPSDITSSDQRVALTILSETHEASVPGRPSQRAVPSVSLGDVAGLPGAEGLSAVLRTLLGPAADEVEAGVTPKALLRAMVSMRRDQGVASPMTRARGTTGFAGGDAERVWVEAGDEPGAPFQTSGAAKPDSTPSRARRTAPSAADVRFAETLAMAPALRSLAGLPARTPATPRAVDVAVAEASAALARTLQQPGSPRSITGRSLAPTSAAATPRGTDGHLPATAGALRDDAPDGSEGQVRGPGRARPQALRRMLGGTALSTLSSSPLLRSLLADERVQPDALFDGAMFARGGSRLVPATVMATAAERFAPISYAQPAPGSELDREATAPEAFFTGGDESPRVLLDGSEAPVDAWAQGPASTGRKGDRGRGATRPRQAAASPAPSPAQSSAGTGTATKRSGTRVQRTSRSMANTSSAVPMPALVATLRQALEARAGMSPNVEAFSHLADVIAEGRARLAAPKGARNQVAAGFEAAATAPDARVDADVDSSSSTPTAGAPRSTRRSADERRAAARGLPIGFGSVLRSRGSTANADAAETTDGDATQAARPAGTGRASVRLSGLALDDRGVPIIGRGTRERAMAPLSDALAMLSVGEAEGGESSSPALAASARVAEKRAVEAVRAAIVAFEKRLASGEGKPAGSADRPTESTATVVVPGSTPARKAKAARVASSTAGAEAAPRPGETSTAGLPATPGASPVVTRAAAPRAPGSVVLAPDATEWATLASLAREALADEQPGASGFDGFVATLAARLGATDASPQGLREAVEAAWGTSHRAPSAAEPVPAIAPSGASMMAPALSGASRALAFGDRVLSFSMPDVTVPTHEGAALPARAGAYERVGTASELTFLQPGEADVPAAEAVPSPAARVAARVRLASALNAAAASSPSTLGPQGARRASDLAERVSGGRALSAAEVRAVVSVLESAGIAVPARAAQALRASGGGLAASPSMASSALARAESWRSLPALRSTSSETGSSQPRGAGAPTAGKASSVGVPYVATSAGTESLRFPLAERVGESAIRMGGNLSTWIAGSGPESTESAAGQSARVVPAMAGRAQALAGWTPLSAAQPSDAMATPAGAMVSSSGVLRPGDYPEAEIGEWLRLEGIESEPEGSRAAPAGVGRRGRTGSGRGAARAVSTLQGRGRTALAAASNERAARTVLAEGGRALTSLGPNLSRWLSPTATAAAARSSIGRVAGLESGAGRSEPRPVGDVGEWLRLESEGGSFEGLETGAARSVGRGLALPMTERREAGALAMSRAALLSETLSSRAGASHLDVGRLGGNLLDLVVLAGEPSAAEAGAQAPGAPNVPSAVGAIRRLLASRDAGAAPATAGATGRGGHLVHEARPSGFAPLEAPHVAGLRARVGGWLQSVYGAAGMSGALSRGRSLEGFASLLLGGGTAAEAARAFSLLEGGSSLTFLDMAGEGSNPTMAAPSTARGVAYRAGTQQPVGRRPEGGVGATVSGVSRGGGAAGQPGTPEGYAAQASADRGAFIETPSAFRSDASAFFAQTAEPAASGGGSAVGPAAGLGLSLVSPVVNVVSQAASFSLEGGQRAGGASVREEVTTSVERVSKGREDSEKELRKVLPELVEMLRRRMRTERERRGL